MEEPPLTIAEYICKPSLANRRHRVRNLKYIFIDRRIVTVSALQGSERPPRFLHFALPNQPSWRLRHMRQGQQDHNREKAGQSQRKPPRNRSRRMAGPERRPPCDRQPAADEDALQQHGGAAVVGA